MRKWVFGTVIIGSLFAGYLGAAPNGFTYKTLQDLANDLRYNQLKRNEILEPHLACKRCVVVAIESAKIHSVYSGRKTDHGPVVMLSESTDRGRGAIFDAVYITDMLPPSIVANFRHGEAVFVSGIVFEYDPAFKPNIQAIRMKGIVVPLDPKDRAPVEAAIRAWQARKK